MRGSAVAPKEDSDCPSFSHGGKRIERAVGQPNRSLDTSVSPVAARSAAGAVRFEGVGTRSP